MNPLYLFGFIVLCIIASFACSIKAVQSAASFQTEGRWALAGVVSCLFGVAAYILLLVSL